MSSAISSCLAAVSHLFVHSLECRISNSCINWRIKMSKNSWSSITKSELRKLQQLEHPDVSVLPILDKEMLPLTCTSLHHGQVFERMAPVLLGFVSRPEELNFSLFGFNFILVFLKFLLGSDVRVSHGLGEGRGGSAEERRLTGDLHFSSSGLWLCRPPYLHGSVTLACRSSLWKLLLDGGEGQREFLQPHLLLQQLDQLLRQVLEGGIWKGNE